MEKQEKTIEQWLDALSLKNGELLSGLETDSMRTIPRAHLKLGIALPFIQKMGSHFDNVFISISKKENPVEIYSTIKSVLKLMEEYEFHSEGAMEIFNKFHTSVGIVSYNWVNSANPYNDSALFLYLKALDTCFGVLEKDINKA